MHSSLQPEFRVAHRLFRDSCIYCRRPRDSSKRAFHQLRSLRSSQGGRHHASSQSIPPSSNEDQTDPTDPSIAPNVPYTRHPFPTPPRLEPSQGGPPSDEPPNWGQILGFHGSLRNRRMRASAPKELPKPHIDIPGWFVEKNATLLGEGELGPSASTSIRYMSEDGRHRGGGDLAAGGAGGPNNSKPVKGNVDVAADKVRSSQSRLLAAQSELLAGEISSDQKDPRYWVDSVQHLEIQMTARGLILPPLKPEHDGEPANKTAHLCLHYAGSDGESLLDDYVQTLAVKLRCDLMALDVQDLAEMIATSHQPPDVVAEARYMSYDVLQSTNTEAESSDSFSFMEEGDDDMEDDGESFESSPLGGSSRLPIVLGKPITIDLAQIFGGKRSNRAASPKSFRNQALSSTIDTIEKTRPPFSPFTDLVEQLLSVVFEKRSKVSATRASTSTGKTMPDSSKPQTMIHIKDIKAVQETWVGGQFLTELYEQVEKRRSNGERIIIVGTECSNKDDVTPTPSQIVEMQKLKNHEISRTIVMTPVLNGAAARNNLVQDRKARIAMINMRHIFEVIQLKTSNTGWFGLVPGFWKAEEWLGNSKQFWASTELGKSVLSFSDVHRVATILAGVADGFHDGDSVLDMTLQHTGKEAALDVVSTLLRESDSSKSRWAKANVSTVKAETKDATVSEDPLIAKIRLSATKHEKKLLSGVIEPTKITTTFNDVHAPVETIDALQTLTTLSLIRPEAFSYGVLASDKIPGLLLYGPPGTGKTLLAKAVAKESGARVLEVSAADINDMYVGEGEKNVKALFSLAKKLSPCVVFLDEADAMFSARATSGRRVSHRELLNQFLKEWDGMSNDSGSAFIMVATNRPMDLDDAVLRRLPRRLLVDLPTEQDRQEILKIHLKNEQLAEDVKLDGLAKATPFYSGSDLKNLAVAAALNAVKEENEARKEHDAKQAETQPVATGEAEKYQYPEKRTLVAKHFDRALEEITASISEDMASLKDIKKFDEQFGDRKGKRRKKPMWGFKSPNEAEKVLDTVKVRET